MKQGFSRAIPILVCSAGLLLTACGGSGGSESSNNSETSMLSLAITDAPVDLANKIVVEFSGISLKPSSGDALVFDFDEPQSIDLLQLQGNAYAALLVNEQVPAGEYSWVRLHVNALEDNVMDSYMELEDGSQIELWVPSGAQTGLKLHGGFVMPAGGAANFTIDFDLRKSVTDPKGKASAILKPSLRMVNNLEVGSIAGTVDSDLVNSVCADPTMDAGAVYLFNGSGVLPVDIQGIEGDPLTTALVSSDGENFVYEIGFVPAGDYTLAYTCEAALDDPEAADVIVFEQSDNVTVSSGEQTLFDIAPVAAETEQ